MIKIVSVTLEEAYKDAAFKLECSVTELNIEVIQPSSSGFLGLFKKSAIIVAAKKTDLSNKVEETILLKIDQNIDTKPEKKPKKEKEQKPKQNIRKERKKEYIKKTEHNYLNDTIMPESFVSTQDDEEYDMKDINYTADYEEDPQEEVITLKNSDACEVAKVVEKELNNLFNLTCFEIDKVEVSAYNKDTLLVEFKGEDAALLIGKEGYRYKALSYMIFNWINTKYKLQLRLEIAEFLKNQEESVNRYLLGVYENVDKDGRAQTKILDGVLIQIALKELRTKYPDKYVAIRSTRDGLKFIIVNDYHSN